MTPIASDLRHGSLATTVWAEFLAGGCPQELRDLARRPYDLTLLTTPDVPWDADDGRCVPGARGTFSPAASRLSAPRNDHSW